MPFSVCPMREETVRRCDPPSKESCVSKDLGTSIIEQIKSQIGCNAKKKKKKKNYGIIY